MQAGRRFKGGGGGGGNEGLGKGGAALALWNLLIASEDAREATAKCSFAATLLQGLDGGTTEEAHACAGALAAMAAASGELCAAQLTDRQLLPRLLRSSSRMLVTAWPHPRSKVPVLDPRSVTLPQCQGILYSSILRHLRQAARCARAATRVPARCLTPKADRRGDLRAPGGRGGVHHMIEADC